MKLKSIVRESAPTAPLEDPFALADYGDDELKGIENPKNSTYLETIHDRQLAADHVKLMQRSYAWNSVRTSIEDAIKHNATIRKLSREMPSLINQWASDADKSNRLNVGITSVDMNLLPVELHEWVRKMAEKGAHAMKMAEDLKTQAHEKALKLFTLQRSAKAKAAAAAKKANQ